MTPRLIYLIKRIETEVTSGFYKTLEADKISPLQYTLLYFIKNSSGDLSSAQLSRRFAMTPQSMNEILGLLQQRRLIHKLNDPNHGRKRIVRLTAMGQKLLDKCNTRIDQMEKEMFSFMKVKEKKEFSNTCYWVLEGLKKE